MCTTIHRIPASASTYQGTEKGGLITASINTISPQGIGAVCLILEGTAPIPYGDSYS